MTIGPRRLWRGRSGLNVIVISARHWSDSETTEQKKKKHIIRKNILTAETEKEETYLVSTNKSGFVFIRQLHRYNRWGLWKSKSFAPVWFVTGQVLQWSSTERSTGKRKWHTRIGCRHRRYAISASLLLNLARISSTSVVNRFTWSSASSSYEKGNQPWYISVVLMVTQYSNTHTENGVISIWANLRLQLTRGSLELEDVLFPCFSLCSKKRTFDKMSFPSVRTSSHVPVVWFLLMISMHSHTVFKFCS